VCVCTGWHVVCARVTEVYVCVCAGRHVVCARVTEEWLQFSKARGNDLQNISNPKYLYIHVAAQSVMQTSNVTKSMKFMKAEDGPYKYITNNDWDSVKALEDLCKGHHRTDIIKFRGKERGILIKRKDLQDCILGPS
jgi:hypothetical protein